VTLIHEYAHALLHVDVDDATERAKREVEAEAVAYIVGRYFHLDTSGSAFYLAAWQDDDAEGLQERLGRISSTRTGDHRHGCRGLNTRFTPLTNGQTVRRCFVG